MTTEQYDARDREYARLESEWRDKIRTPYGRRRVLAYLAFVQHMGELREQVRVHRGPTGSECGVSCWG